MQVLAKIVALIDIDQQSPLSTDGKNAEVERLVQRDLEQMEEDWLQFRACPLDASKCMLLHLFSDDKH